MTDEQQKSLLKELLAIREGMATRADLLKLEEGLTGIIIKLAESGGSATQTASPASEAPAIAACLRSCAQTITDNKMQGWEAAEYVTAYALTVETHAKSVPSLDPARRDANISPSNYKMEKLKTELARLTERVDRLSNWYQGLQSGLDQERKHCIEHHERLCLLESNQRSATQTEQPAPLGMGGQLRGPWFGGYDDSVPTPATETPAQNSSKTDTEEPKRSATQTEQPADLAARIRHDGPRVVAESMHFFNQFSETQSVPPHTTDPLAQDSTKTNKEEK